MKSEVLWARAQVDVPPMPPLSGDLEVDVAIVGGGIVGLTAAHMLAASHTVAVFEAATIGGQATGRSSAKATSQHGPIYRQMVSDIGEEAARAYARVNNDAIDWIAGMAGPNGETFQRAEAHTFARTAREAEDLRAEADTARGLGLPASFGPKPDLGIPNEGVLTFANQGQINPWLLLRTLAAKLKDRARVFEHTRVLSVEHGEPCVLKTATATVRARWVIVATQIPVVPEGKFFAKAFPHAHPVVGCRLNGAAVPSGMIISAGSPTRSFRTAPINGEDWLVATGEPFRPGETDAQDQAFASLAAFLRESYGLEPEVAWVNEDFKPMDGLPFVGHATTSTPNLLVATGFNAWGITNGVVSGGLLADIVNGHPNALAPVFDAARLRPLKGGPTFIMENTKAGIQMVRDRALRRRVASLDTIAPGGGGIISHNGQQVAVSRDASGAATAVSAICTHLGCVLGWNGVDRTWDCPCHGSRFAATGEVIAGPATTALAPVDLIGSDAPGPRGAAN